MSKQRKHVFGGNIIAAQKNKRRKSGVSNYLNLPKGVSLLNFDDTLRKVKIDILAYIVTDERHPDRNEKENQAIEGNLWYRRPYLLHRSIGADNKSFVCLKSVGKKCPICEYQRDLFNTDRKAAIALYPKERNLYVAIPIGLKKLDEVPYIWDMAESLFEEELSNELSEDESKMCFPLLEGGKTLECSLKWKSIGDGRPFPEVTHIEFLDRDDYDEEVLDSLPNLDEVLIILTYDELKSKFFEEDEAEEEPAHKSIRRAASEEDDDNAEDEPKERKRKPFTRKKEEPEKSEGEVTTMQRRRKTVPESDKEDDEGRKNKCPFGHKFGADIDSFNDCDKCSEWDPCDEENRKITKK